MQDEQEHAQTHPHAARPPRPPVPMSRRDRCILTLILEEKRDNLKQLWKELSEIELLLGLEFVWVESDSHGVWCVLNSNVNVSCLRRVFRMSFGMSWFWNVYVSCLRLRATDLLACNLYAWQTKTHSEGESILYYLKYVCNSTDTKHCFVKQDWCRWHMNKTLRVRILIVTSAKSIDIGGTICSS